LKNLLFLLTFLLLKTNISFSQEDFTDYSKSNEYIIAEVNIIGTKFLDKNTLISISGLNVGDKIDIPGENISKSIKKLWKLGLFSDVSISIGRIEGERIFLNINLKEHSKLSKFKFEGKIKKHDISELKEQLKIFS